MSVGPIHENRLAIRHRRVPVDAARGRVPAEASRHLPAVAALHYFGVPFAMYDAHGRRLYTSPGASELLERDERGDSLGTEAEWLVTEALSAPQGSNGAADWDVITVEAGACALTAYRVAGARDGSSIPGRAALIIVLSPLPLHARRRLNQFEPFGLTPREHDVASLISAGLSAKGIAARLSISLHTAKRHTERVYAKLGVHSRVGVSLALQSLRIER